MKIVRENLSENEMVVIPQDSDDLYYLYHIVSSGDVISAKTSRKMKDTGDRITLWMKLSVEEVEFHGFGDTIRIRGRILEASDENVSLGSYHAITIELYSQLSIVKSTWTPSEVDRLRSAQMGESRPLVVVAMDDESAIVTQVGSHASKILLDLDPGIPRKGHDPDGHILATQEYFHELARFLRTQREDGTAQYIVIGGPGFTKDAFYDFLKLHYRDLISNLTVVSISSAGRAGVREIVLGKIPENFMAGQTAKHQAELIQEILEILGKDTGEIAYGSDVPRAADMGAVEKLLVLDRLLHDTVERRQQIEELMTQVKQMGGKTILISSMHDSSNTEILEGLGGIVAILRFPLPK